MEGSHKWEIEPLVDFWYPYFSDKLLEDGQKHKIQSLPVSGGDGIVFFPDCGMAAVKILMQK